MSRRKQVKTVSLLMPKEVSDYFRKYPRQAPCAAVIKCEMREDVVNVYATFNPLDNAVSADIFNGFTQIFGFNECVKVTVIRRIMKNIAPMIAKLKESYVEEVENGNLVGKVDQDIYWKIQDYIDENIVIEDLDLRYYNARNYGE